MRMLRNSRQKRKKMHTFGPQQRTPFFSDKSMIVEAGIHVMQECLAHLHSNLSRGDLEEMMRGERWWLLHELTLQCADAIAYVAGPVQARINKELTYECTCATDYADCECRVRDSLGLPTYAREATSRPERQTESLKTIGLTNNKKYATSQGITSPLLLEAEAPSGLPKFVPPTLQTLSDRRSPRGYDDSVTRFSSTEAMNPQRRRVTSPPRDPPPPPPPAPPRDISPPLRKMVMPPEVARRTRVMRRERMLEELHHLRQRIEALKRPE